MAGTAGHDPIFKASIDEAFKLLGSRRDGLSGDEAAARLKRNGPNLPVTSIRRTLAAKALRRLADPLVAILLIAAFISGVTGDWQSFVVIVVIVLMSIVLDLVQEQKAEKAVDALKRSVAVTATVRRDGAWLAIPVQDVVKGDVVHLASGDLVPADGLVLVAQQLLVNEAVLTGETYAVEKREAAASDHDRVLYSGTSVVGGEADLLVSATGPATRFGAIAASLQEREPPTAFETGLHSLGMLILRLTGFLVLFVLLTQLWRHGLSVESFLFAVALAVGLTPELLPMVVTVTLARGAERMSKKKVVVKRLSAIHDLGSMDILCTDKTGTLTEARIALVDRIDADGQSSQRVEELLRRNSALIGGMRSALDDAILANGGLGDENWAKGCDLPFDFDRRRASVMTLRDGKAELVTKGAPEAILACCTHVERNGAIVPLDEAGRSRIAAMFEQKGSEGFRLLAVAYRPIDPTISRLAEADEHDLVFAGCGVFLDPPKASAKDAIVSLRKAGIALKIISGDAAPVVAHLVQSLDIPAKGMLTGEEIEAMTDAALASRVVDTDLFVRVSPDQKRRIVLALRRRGHTTGFLGDGINDAPAIHAADVGLSVEGGTDVAREAADIILLATDLQVIADGVAEGRRTFANIMKYVRMGTSSNFGNMLSTALASLVLPFLPLAPLQILLNNLLYDLSEIGIPFDRADEEELATPKKWDMGQALHFTLVMGPLSSLFDLTTFAVLIFVFKASAPVFQTAWFVESILTQILVIFVIRTAKPFWKSRAHPILTATSLGALAVSLGIALSGIGAFFGFVSLPLPLLGAIVLISAGYLTLAEIIKRFAFAVSSGRRLHHPAFLRH
ncbi:Mg2+-importing ATPase [Kaistia hirudinis]|uniref:Magnesium-transporting ATPase, P-type 1 n=1 Tax=Kaistia hirudinis TaxID=1293440 RepID=A0A840AJ49_9HYPH|nr:magnesium-translocating P-type ATPase [Kaistia hirudinis]MBB3929438.1 Mg2+-importing ATPase [Kaistia hirudinis]